MNFAFPILLLPFYITVFGINNYGVIVLATSLINIVSVIPDYSWIVLGVKNLLSFKNNSNNINNYISKVINIKFILFLLSVFFLVFLLAFYSDINSNLVLCLSLIFQLFSRSQNAHWIFLGINKVKIYFYINSICKIMSIFFVFLYIKNAKDIDVLFFILGFFDFLMIILAFVYLRIRCGFKYKYFKVMELLFDIKSGFKMFLANLSNTSLINSSTLILGLFLSPSLIGIYSVAEKIIMLCKHSIGVLFQGIYPKVYEVFLKDGNLYKKYLNIIFKSYFIIYGLILIVLIGFSSRFILFFSKEYVSESAWYLILLSPLPLINALNQPAYMTLIIYKLKHNCFIGYFAGCILNIMLSFILVNYLSVYGIIISLICTEVFITLYFNFIVVSNKKLNFFKL